MEIFSKLYYHTWNIGFVEHNIKEIILSQYHEVCVNWLKHSYVDRFFADPFILDVSESYINVLVEEFPYWNKKGRISLLTVDRKDYTLINRKVILDKPFHMSYPFIQRDTNGFVKWVAPEASMSGKLMRYNLNRETMMLDEPTVLASEPLVDSTIVEYSGQFWLFCTKRGENANSCLYIYYSDKPEGPWIPHLNNPVVNNPINARPAGSVVNIDGILYRLIQKCDVHYGESIIVSKIKLLTISEFKEVYIKELRAKKDIYSHSFHTMNGIDNVCVVDGVRVHFAPLRRMVFELLSKLHKIVR